MDEFQNIAILAGFAFFYSVLASRLERTIVSGALVYVAFGLVCGPFGLHLIDLNVDEEGLKLLAELTLALVLFTDAANADLTVLKRVAQVPFRLLAIGLPLVIALGLGVGLLLFDGLGIFEIALLATMLAPTDAALGQAVVSNKSVPVSVRTGLSVESGLNDGICVPVLFIFLALAAGQTDGGKETLGLVLWLPVQEIGIGAVVGVIFAAVAYYTFKGVEERGWVVKSWRQIPAIALAFACFAAAQTIGGSGFIASFIGGLVFNKLAQQHKETVLHGAHAIGDTMALLTWIAFGAVIVGKAFQHFSWEPVVYALLSLTLIRMIPTMLCLAGSGLRVDTKLFLGWFGPRGLASIVFIVIVVGESLPGQETLEITVAWTVIFSVIAHGLTAIPLAKLFGARVDARSGVL